jgi:hypothetical protein
MHISFRKISTLTIKFEYRLQYGLTDPALGPSFQVSGLEHFLIFNDVVTYCSYPMIYSAVTWLLRSTGLRWYINISFTIPDIIHRPDFYLKLNSTLQVIHMSVQHLVACVIWGTINAVNATLFIYFSLLEDVILLRHVSVHFRTIFRLHRIFLRKLLYLQRIRCFASNYLSVIYDILSHSTWQQTHYFSATNPTG